MTAIEITEHGGPEVLKPATRPVPTPGKGEVLVKVAAAGVNRPDIAQRAGHYPPPPGASDIPGLEIAGTVVALGPEVTSLKLGDEICALVAGGGYAEYCVVPEPQALPIPKGLTPLQAAALPETYFTVWTNVFDRGRLQPGESILIHGGASGIGTTAIQLSKAFGATVYATAGTAAKCEACVKLGAKRAINYRTEDFVEVIEEETGGNGVNLVLDMVCGDYVPRNMRCLAIEGRLVVIALLGGRKGTIDFAHLMRRRQTVTGSTLRPRSVAEKGAIAASLRAKVWPLIEAGKVGPIIQKTFPLAEAARAHAALEAGDHIGKFMLAVG
ncbi:MAG TPA: NAD(P)H-quinone oxidoreductase [Alphaproteobacteria bacterium]